MFEAVDLARFAIRANIYLLVICAVHTRCMTVTVAALEWTYVSTGKEEHTKMAKFWGKLFLINLPWCGDSVFRNSISG